MPLNHRNIKPKIKKVRPLPNRRKMVIRAHMNKATAVEEKPMVAETTVEEPIVENVVEETIQEQPETVEVVEDVPEEVVEEKPKRRSRKKTDKEQTEISDDSAGTD